MRVKVYDKFEYNLNLFVKQARFKYELSNFGDGVKEIEARYR